MTLYLFLRYQMHVAGWKGSSSKSRSSYVPTGTTTTSRHKPAVHRLPARRRS